MKLSVNHTLERALIKAQDCTRALDEMGAAVIEITFSGRNVVVHVDQEPRGIATALMSRIRQDGGQTITKVARLAGCEVRWTHRHDNVVDMTPRGHCFPPRPSDSHQGSAA